MNRRRFLELAAAGTGLVAGCAESQEGNGDTPRESTEAHTTNSRVPTTSGQDRSRTPNPQDAFDIDIGVTYHLSHPSWTNCIDGGPAVSEYDGLEPDVVDQHVDQLRDAGVSRVLVRVSSPDDLREVDEFLDFASDGAPRVQLVLPLVDVLDLGRSLEADLGKIAEWVRDTDAYSTFQERPVFTIQNVPRLRRGADGERLWSRMADRFGDGSEFVDAIRTGLSVDGQDAFVEGAVGTPNSFAQFEPRYVDFLAEFDGLTNGFWPRKPAHWDATTNWLVQTFSVISAFTDEMGMEFVPQVVPGFDGRHNRCQSFPSFLQRDPEQFRSLLDVAGTFASTNRIQVNSFNGWATGTQIEPGTYGGTAYGTQYLDAVREFQAHGSTDDLPDRDMYYASPDGSNEASGSQSEPVRHAQVALAHAGPGDTVRLQSGHYYQTIRTVRDGDRGEPITITGPPDAFVHGVRDDPGSVGLTIEHSHLHVLGVTFDGALDPGKPEDPDAYAEGNISTREPLHRPITDEDYHTDLVLKPSGVGNVRHAAINVEFVTNVEIGEFELIGPTGLHMLYGDAQRHDGEVVYVGTPLPGVVEDRLQGPDTSHDVHVHHIDNSAGHPHAELVDVKGGVHDVTIEYCTDAGGGANYLNPGETYWGEAAFHLIGSDTTLRWCVVEDSHGHGVWVGPWGPSHPERFEEINGFPVPDYATSFGQGNSVYGNRITGNRALAVHLPGETDDAVPGYGIDAQDRICGNEVEGETDADPDSPCPDPVQAPGTIGHLGGDSPWD